MPPYTLKIIADKVKNGLNVYMIQKTEPSKADMLKIENICSNISIEELGVINNE